MLTQPPMRLPRNGDLLLRTYQSSKGPVDLLAETHTEGKTLHLSGIAIYPRGDTKLELGMRELLRLKSQLTADVHALGYTKLHITGKRLTGAKPGKTPDLWFDTAPVATTRAAGPHSARRATP